VRYLILRKIKMCITELKIWKWTLNEKQHQWCTPWSDVFDYTMYLDDGSMMDVDTKEDKCWLNFLKGWSRNCFLSCRSEFHCLRYGMKKHHLHVGPSNLSQQYGIQTNHYHVGPNFYKNHVERHLDPLRSPVFFSSKERIFFRQHSAVKIKECGLNTRDQKKLLEMSILRKTMIDFHRVAKWTRST
jgi:hypothetical protein